MVLMAIQICAFTALPALPKMASMRRGCLVHLQNGSTCQRILPSVQVVSAGNPG
jgi:hypothetical protein